MSLTRRIKTSKVDVADYKGREQAYVKHQLLESYLPTLAYKVGREWDSIVYVDGFSGPWGVKRLDLSDSSFGIAIDALRRCQRGMKESIRPKMLSILVEQGEAFAELDVFAMSKDIPGFGVKAYNGEFVEQIQKITEEIAKTRNPFRFFFLDPKGWKDIPMVELSPLLKHRSCEVLINFMTQHITRFIEEPSREDSYIRLFGREGVLEKIRSLPRQEREEGAVKEYCESLKQVCGFKYVSSAVILEPGKEDVKYFLVYATHHPMGVEVFKKAEIHAANVQDDVRHEVQVVKTGQDDLFSFAGSNVSSTLVETLRAKYKKLARQSVIRALAGCADETFIDFDEVFGCAMAFPLVTPDDLLAWLGTLEPHLERKPASPTSKTLKINRRDRILIKNRAALAKAAR